MDYPTKCFKSALISLMKAVQFAACLNLQGFCIDSSLIGRTCIETLWTCQNHLSCDALMEYVVYIYSRITTDWSIMEYRARDSVFSQTRYIIHCKHSRSQKKGSGSIES